MARKMNKAETAKYQKRFGAKDTEQLGQTEYVVFGFDSINKRVVRMGGYKNFTIAKSVAKAGASMYHHSGVAKVTHPQRIWFYKGGEFVHLNDDLVLEIITLLGV